jgi:hypothetical protein
MHSILLVMKRTWIENTTFGCASKNNKNDFIRMVDYDYPAGKCTYHLRV